MSAKDKPSKRINVRGQCGAVVKVRTWQSDSQGLSHYLGDLRQGTAQIC